MSEYSYSPSHPRSKPEKKYTRYLIMGLRDGKLVKILARRGHDPESVVEQARMYINKRGYERLYIVTVGEDGQYGESTNLKLQEIVSPPPTPAYALVDVESIF